MTFIRGLISIDGRVSITCCQSVSNIKIDGVSLYDFLDGVFNLDAEPFWNGQQSQSPTYRLRYCVLNKVPTEETSLDSLAGQIIAEQISGEYVSGCYSEYTCGWGGFDYVLNESRSIFNELSGFDGKYIHLEI